VRGAAAPPGPHPPAQSTNVLAAALVAGNAVLYKPSELTPRTGALLATCFAAAGLPKGLLQVVPSARSYGAPLAAAKGVAMFCFTGSTATGRRAGQAAHRAGTPRVALELGGKDAAYVRADVGDVAAAAAALADGAFYNSGQSCCSVERVYVHTEVYDAFLAAFCAAVAGFRVGHPALDSAAYITPLARGGAAFQVLQAQLDDALAKGARIAHRTPAERLPARAAAGPPRAPRPGVGLDPAQRGAPVPVYFPPTVLVDVDHSMSVMRDESFGPLIGIQRVSSDGEAAALMDDSSYGLTAAVYSADEAAATAILRSLTVGTAYWNACDRVSPRTPWSGRRDSGVGCTLGEEGLRAFTQPKAFHFVTPAK